MTCEIGASSQQTNLGGGGIPASRQEAQQHSIPSQRQDQNQGKTLEEAEQLQNLAQELKASVDKTNQNVLSVDVIRKAERLEKLAHQVKLSTQKK